MTSFNAPMDASIQGRLVRLSLLDTSTANCKPIDTACTLHELPYKKPGRGAKGDGGVSVEGFWLRIINTYAAQDGKIQQRRVKAYRMKVHRMAWVWVLSMRAMTAGHCRLKL